MKRYLLILLMTTGALAQTHTFPATDTNNVFTGTNQFTVGTQVGPSTFAALPTAANGTTIYCSDCVVTNPCAASGTGAMATRVNNAWSCTSGGVVATSTAFTGVPWIDLIAAGAVCNNSTDDTTAFNAALATLKNQGGGTLVVPAGKQCLIAAQVTLPNDGGSPPAQKPIRITSSATAAADARGVAPTNMSGTLNLTFNAANAKILTFGNGQLEIDHITLTDTAADCAAFIMTTSTVVNIHDVLFAGTTSGAACNDAVIFGGTGTVLNGGVTSPFQGYGSRLINSWFNKIRRAALLQTYANGIVIKDNTIEASCGSNLANGAAIEISGDVSNADVGNKIEGNLIEMSGYVYPIKLTQRANDNLIFGNDCYDPGGGTLACIRVETGNAFNLIGTTFNGSVTAVSDVDGNDTYITPISAVASLFPQGITSKGLIRQTGGNAGSWYDILNTVDSTESYWQLNNGATTPHLDLAVKPAGGTAAFMAAFRRNGATASITDLGDGGDTDVRLRTNSSGADFRIATTGSSQVVWLCGGAVQCKNQVNNNGQLSNTASVGVAPFVVTSTTPVANLTTVPTTYNHSGTQQTAVHIVEDTCTLGTSCSVTLTGAAVFTSSSSYMCSATDKTAAAAVQFNPSSGSAFALTGTGTDVLSYICVGN